MRNRSRRLVLTIVSFVLAALFLSFVAPVVDARQLKPVAKLRVFDANNKLVGLADLSDTDEVQVLFQLGDQVFAVEVERDFFEASEDISYTSTDCSGTPLLDPIDEGEVMGLLETAIGPPGNTVYFADPKATPQTFTVRSTFVEGACESVGPFDFTGVPGLPLIDLFTQFTPPFSVR